MKLNRIPIHYSSVNVPGKQCLFYFDFTAENKNIYNLHGWQLGVTNKTRSQFAAYKGDKIIN